MKLVKTPARAGSLAPAHRSPAPQPPLVRRPAAPASGGRAGKHTTPPVTKNQNRNAKETANLDNKLSRQSTTNSKQINTVERYLQAGQALIGTVRAPRAARELGHRVANDLYGHFKALAVPRSGTAKSTRTVNQ
jgi:hypothetical protein